MLTGNCLKVVNNLRKRRPEYENIEKVDKNIHLLIILFARKSFVLKLFPPEAALPRSPKKSGWTFTRHIFPGQIFSGWEISRPEMFWPGNFPVRFFLAENFPGQIFSGREISRQEFFWPGWLGVSLLGRGSGPENYSSDLPLIFENFFGHENSRRESYGIVS